MNEKEAWIEQESQVSMEKTRGREYWSNGAVEYWSNGGSYVKQCIQDKEKQ